MDIKRPLIWVLASYLAGLASYPLKPVYIAVITVISLLPVVLWLFLPQLFRKEKLRNYFFLLSLPVFFVLGFNRMNGQLSANRMDSAFESEIRGAAAGQLAMIQEKEDYQILILKNTEIKLDKGMTYSGNKISVYTTSKTRFKIGYLLNVSGKIKKFQKASNQGQFNELLYNKMQHIDYKLNADSVNIIDGKYSAFHQFLYELKKGLTGVYQKILPPKNAGILSAMILGEMSLLDDEMKDLYRQSGISHILAISGLHISLLGLTLYRLFRRLGFPMFLTTGIYVFIIDCYGILTNFGVSTNRAVVMMVILMAAGMIGRTYDLLSATALSALIILIQSPLQITNAGFLLSFGAIMGIALMNPVISDLIPLKGSLWDGFKSSMGIQIITLPVILYFFYEFPTYSVIINMIILPTSTAIILLAILAGIAGCIWLPAGVFFIGGVHYLLNFYEWVCRLGAKLPGKVFLIGRPDLWIIAAYYSVVFLIIFFHLSKKRRFCIILLSFLLIIFIKPRNINFKITFLDVGQGDGIFMMTPKGTTYFVDGGSSDVSQVGRYRIEPYLKANGIRCLDYAIVTHMDYDHISGLKEIIEDMERKPDVNNQKAVYNGYIQISNLILPDTLKKEEAYMELVNSALDKGINVMYIGKDDTLSDGEVNFTCLNPAPDYIYSSENAYSTVLSVSYKKFDLLLTGDLEEAGEKLVLELLKSHSDDTAITKDNKEYQGIPSQSDYDILKVAHHGSNYSTPKEFLDLIKPEVSIISCGKNNRYGHPAPQLLNRLKDAESTIKITSESGAVTIKTDGEKMELTEFKSK